jgi:hypothetical protein
MVFRSNTSLTIEEVDKAALTASFIVFNNGTIPADVYMSAEDICSYICSTAITTRHAETIERATVEGVFLAITGEVDTSYGTL